MYVKLHNLEVFVSRQFCKMYSRYIVSRSDRSFAFDTRRVHLCVSW